MCFASLSANAAKPTFTTSPWFSDRRRRGVATALVQALFPIAAALGAWAIFVQADIGDAPAIAFYSRLGSREDVLHFDIAPPRRGIP